MTKSELSPTMHAALALAKEAGKLERMPGSYWVKPGAKWDGSGYGVSFGGSTINALIERGLLVVTKTKDGKKKQFPVEVRIPMVRIWSGQWRKYWRANAGGYTSIESEAGLYTREDANRFLAHAGPEKKLEIRPVEATK